MGGHQGAVCIPSRAMLMTGRYVTRLPGDGGTIPDSLVSLPEVLQTKGYTTFHTGKWHSDKASHNRMFNAGDNIFFGGMHFGDKGGQEHPTVYHYDKTGTYPSTDMIRKDTFSSTLYAETAIRFLQSAEAKEKPFLCYVAFTSPHDPRTPPEKFRNMYDPSMMNLPENFMKIHPFDNGDMNVRDEMLLGKPRNADSVKREIALYYGMISELDEQIGRIIAALEKAGLRETTLIVFAGDNGLAVGQHGLLGKQNLYEHSIRVPMIMAGPGIPKNVRTDNFTYLSDINPTIYDYFRIHKPATVEALSLMPVIKNPRVKTRNQIYNVYGNWSRSLKTADGFKLIVYNVKGEKHTQLFNLKKDPWEIHNLSEDKVYQNKIISMKNILRKEMKDKHDIELW
jgi:arylsulfatase A-like enzyme